MSSGAVAVDQLGNLEVSNMRLEFFDSGGVEMKWCLFVIGKRASIGKVIVDVPGNVTAASNSAESAGSSKHSSYITSAKTAHIKSVFLHKDFRGKGLSKYLINRCKLSLAENGFDRIILEAEEDTSRHGKLVKLYQECGFHVLGDESLIKYEYNDEECFRKVPMECWIKPKSFQPQNQANSLEKNLSQNGIEDDVVNNQINQNDQVLMLVLEMGGEDHVRELRTHMLHDFVLRMKEEALIMDRAQMTIIEALRKLDEKVPGSFNKAILVAKYINDAGHPDWLQFSGLVYELGRIQETFLWRTPFTIEKQRRARERRSQIKQLHQSSATINQNHAASSATSPQSSISTSTDKSAGNTIKSHREYEEYKNNKELEQESDAILMQDIDEDLSLDDSNFLNHKGWPLPEWTRCDFTEPWITGFKLPDTLPYASKYNQLNADHITALSTESPEYGLYSAHIGMSNVNVAWNHAEYLSIILKENESLGLPIEAINVLRFQNLTSWLDHENYKILMDEDEDDQLLDWTRLFRDLVNGAISSFVNQEDLKDLVPSEEDMEFVNSLVEKYFPGVLKW